jgi:hypothetical protein
MVVVRIGTVVVGSGVVVVVMMMARAHGPEHAILAQ